MNNYYTIKILLKEVQLELQNLHFNHAFSFLKSSISLSFYSEANEYQLVVSSEKNHSSCYLNESAKEPRTNAAFFFTQLKGLTVKQINQVENERAIEIHLSDQTYLLITLFGSTSNVFWIKNDQIQESFKQAKKWNGKLVSSLFPPLAENKINPTIPRSIILNEAPKLPRNQLDELLHYSNSVDFDEQQLRELARSWVHILESNPSPRILTDFRFTLFPESVLPIETKMSFNSVNEAIKRTWSIVLNESRLKEEKQSIQIRFEQKIRYLESLLSQWENHDKQEKQSKRWVEFGHLLMSQPNPNRMVSELEVVDYFNENETITIPLKHDLSLVENADRYYKRASNAKKSIEILQKQAHSAHIQFEELKPVYLDLLSLNKYQQLLDWKKKNHSLLEQLNTQKGDAQLSEGFAVFRIDGYDIWMGKNAKSNDILLQRAHKEDLWFHARGVGGSHVLVRMNKRKENPAQFFMEKIASLAAWHSQTKGSSMVPVQFTRRKFLRKPKGADAGLVIVDKEQVLLVSPKKLIE